ncbi:beta-lactamase/transpeptidase-like protein [Mycena rebaudengoi]|nr:beta-lactamase/transpeptidase-like protein [Mycena rebaudengoi]
MILLTALSVFLAAARASETQTPLDTGLHGGKIITDEFSSYIRNAMQAYNVSGLSLGVLRPDGQVEYGSWGNRTEEGDPVTPATVFNLGSCSKAFLPASLGILMEDFAAGKNKTALPPTDLLPEEWMVEDPWTNKKANLKDLLSHVTGLSGYILLPTVPNRYTALDIVLRMRHLRTAYELREHFEYNNMMYMAGTHVVTRYSGPSYRDFVEQRIMQPLGMYSSTLYPDRAFNSGNLTQAWTPSGRRIPFFLPEQLCRYDCGCWRRHVHCGGYGTFLFAQGPPFTYVAQLKWVKLHLNGGIDATTGVSVIPSATFDLATSAQSIAFPKGDATNSLVAYGMGWGRNSYRGHEVVKHNGGAPGVATCVVFYPHDNFGLVILENTGTGFRNIVEQAVTDRILGLPTEPSAFTREPSPSAAPRSSSPPPPLDLSEYAGTYTSPGYGNITICARESTSSVCSTVVNKFETVDRATGRRSEPSELYSAWPRFWSTELRFVHLSENVFSVTSTTLYVNGYGKDKTPFENLFGTGPSTFAVEEGKVVGFGTFTALRQSWRSKKGGSLRDTADVWFEKVI